MPHHCGVAAGRAAGPPSRIKSFFTDKKLEAFYLDIKIVQGRNRPERVGSLLADPRVPENLLRARPPPQPPQRRRTRAGVGAGTLERDSTLRDDEGSRWARRACLDDPPGVLRHDGVIEDRMRRGRQQRRGLQHPPRTQKVDTPRGVRKSFPNSRGRTRETVWGRRLPRAEQAGARARFQDLHPKRD